MVRPPLDRSDNRRLLVANLRGKDKIEIIAFTNEINPNQESFTYRINIEKPPQGGGQGKKDDDDLEKNDDDEQGVGQREKNSSNFWVYILVGIVALVGIIVFFRRSRTKASSGGVLFSEFSIFSSYFSELWCLH